ncbi:metallophosphoesterase family protein [Williamsia sterculiae]|uniref:Nuclease SbcCD subunit D n=1 Tax=Williamsia sterculiae TaxID=1344003 RepID=A0A1N7E262_9NOCA|nr:DNA repair exonuclease [Williamsia sterculiae]SIR82035.1 DNA repair exonuclease SbcCD nuclease subunit [Williamsia sterculiae]
MTTAQAWDGSLFDDRPGAEPERAVTFVHTADWQLGMTRHFLGTDAQATYTAAREEAIERVGDLAREVAAAFVLVCGDVFEDPRVSTQIVRRALDRLSAIDVPVYVLPGNHDPLDAASVYRSRTFVSGRPDNVIVLDASTTVEPAPGVRLVAAPWRTKTPHSDLVADALRGVHVGPDITILAGHGGVDDLTGRDDPATVSLAGMETAIASGLLDYVALGDRHSVTEVGSTGRIWYPGAHEVTNYDHRETDPGQALVVRLTRGRCRTVEVTPHRVGRWAFRSLRRELSGDADIDALCAELESIADKSRVVVQLGLRGALPVAARARLDDELLAFGERFAALTLWDKETRLSVLSADDDFADLGLTGYAADAVADLGARTRDSDPATADRAADATTLLYRLLGERS